MAGVASTKADGVDDKLVDLGLRVPGRRTHEETKLSYDGEERDQEQQA